MFKNLIRTFGKHSLIMLTYYNGLKVGIKLLKISYVRILFLVSLLYVAVINPFSVFFNFKLLNILVYIVGLYNTALNICITIP